ncbi:hypothetical protein JRF84_07975 [Methylobacterium organophilum]|uniref:hypothetical protein n=1 Tax=Methylobacterium TaxID=407 RepID=UPI0019D1C303|nr:hypothetical protein [Methylobacterium organophilum]MBN6819526.1 hypothetical protein [Methylobacterium organophilum]
MTDTKLKPADGNPVETQEQPKDPANLPAATEVSTSGAVQQVVPDVDLSHPAVDDNPRARTSVVQNAIDFNDPTISGADAVVNNLNAQGVPTKGGEEAAADVKAPAKRSRG